MKYLLFLLCTALQLLAPKFAYAMVTYRLYGGDERYIWTHVASYANGIQNIALCGMLLIGATFLWDYKNYLKERKKRSNDPKEHIAS